MSEAEFSTTKEWVNSLSMKQGYKELCCKFFQENEIDFKDLLQMQNKNELTDLGIKLNPNSLDALWAGIEQLIENRKGVSIKLDQPRSLYPMTKEKEKGKSDESGKKYTNGSNENNFVIGGMSGLKNMGNTCFMNSAIQCLLHAPGFTNALIEAASQDKISNEAKSDEYDEYSECDRLQLNGRTKEEWFSSLANGDMIDFQSKFGWYAAVITSINSDEVAIEYRTYNDTDKVSKQMGLDNVLSRIDAPNTHDQDSTFAQHWRHDIKPNDMVDFCHTWPTVPNEWIECKVRCIYNYGHAHLLQLEWNIINEYGSCSCTRCVSRFSPAIAKHGEYTQGSNMERNERGNGGNGIVDVIKRVTTYFGDKKISVEQKAIDQLTFYQAWLAMITEVHLNRNINEKNENALTPKAIYSKMVDYDSSLGDGGQHDAIEALSIILHGVSESLPDSLNYNGDKSNNNKSVYTFEIPQTIYDNDFKWDMTMDEQMCNKLIETNSLNFGCNVVSCHFDGIIAILETCLNCGFQRRLYSIFGELSLPVTRKTFNVDLVYYSLKHKKYETISLNVSRDCNVAAIKFLAMCGIMKKAKQWSNMNRFEMITICENFENLNQCTSILNDNDSIFKKLDKGKTLLMVPCIKLASLTNQNNDTSVKSVLACKTDDNLLFCVLILPLKQFNHNAFKMGLNDCHARYPMLKHMFGDKIVRTSYNFVCFYENKTNEHDNDIYQLKSNCSNNCMVGYFVKCSVRHDNCIDNETQTLIDSYHAKIGAFGSINEAITYLENEITLYNGNGKASWSYKFLNKNGKNEKNVESQKNKTYVKACTIVQSELQELEMIMKREGLVNEFKKAINSFYQSQNVSKLCNYKYEIPLKSLNDCIDDYCSIKYMPKSDVSPAFQCHCHPNDTVPFIQTQNCLVIGPKLLIVSFARGSGRYKHTHDISFGENLTLTNGDKFKLQSVCNHLSDRTKFGHYTTTVKRLGTEIWYECDDGYCSIAKSKYSSRNALMMIYQNVGR